MYNAVVIGGGPAGYVAAIRLSQLGKKVALVEKENLGGTCTNQGCIPTKAMLTAAHLYSEMNEKGKKFGISAENISYDISGVMKHTNKSVTMSRKGIEFLMKKNKIDVYKGTGILEDKNHVKVNDEILETEFILLANGSEPVMFKPFSEVPGIWTSNDVFKMNEIPESVLIIGGGVIGVEFSTFFASMGKKVYLVELSDHILPSEDPDTADEIKKSLKRKGVEIFEKFRVSDVKPSDNGFISFIESEDDKKAIESAKVLLAVGRKPVISEDMKKIGLNIEKGIVTDDTLKTNIENIYAIGDIKAKVMLAHVASSEGITAAHNIAGENRKMDYSAVPSVIFSSPEVASTGIREFQTVPENVIVSKFPVSANGRARTMEEKDGFVKVICDKTTKKILGISIVSPNATDMIMEGVIAVRNGLTLDNLLDSIHPHPTFTESILGALEGIEGMTIHL
ncbi:MAG TPA: dihydrolipoyl dehydrogenase [Tepiditoga sp.]|nr:dihydrolipoyl dehydrogenase [Thermotogota bacterium]HOO74979.1 dihydrolipoyl dehydrogenase [Tepiditoga sp.]